MEQHGASISRAALLIAAASLVIAASGCGGMLGKVVTKPDVTFDGLTLRGVSFTGADVGVKFLVTNPNPFSVPLERYAYTFMIGDHTIARGDEGSSVSVPARGEGSFTVPVSITFQEVIDAVESLRGSDELPYSISGDVQVTAGPLGGITIPFSHSATVPRPRAPEIRLETIKTRSIGLAGAAVDVVLEVRNPGRFSYVLDALKTTISLNGRQFANIDGLSQAVRLPGEGTQQVTIPINLSGSELLGGIMSILESGHASYELRGDAGLSTEQFGRLPMELRRTGSVELTR